MKLTPIERETILNLNEGEDTASLYTYNEKLQKRFDQMAAEYLESVSRNASSCGAITYDFPKKLLIISFQRPLSEVEKNGEAIFLQSTAMRINHRDLCRILRFIVLDRARTQPSQADLAKAPCGQRVSSCRNNSDCHKLPPENHSEPPCRKKSRRKAGSRKRSPTSHKRPQ